LLVAVVAGGTAATISSTDAATILDNQDYLSELITRLKAKAQASKVEEGDHWEHFNNTLDRLVRERAEAGEVAQGQITLEKLTERRNRQALYHSYRPDWYSFKIEAATDLLTFGEGGQQASQDSPAAALLTLKSLMALARWERESGRGAAGSVGHYQGARCGEFLYQATPQPRRYPLARYIMKKKQNFFDLLILDEAHEFAGQGSAQEKAAHRLVEMAGVPTLALTGSLMNGMASSLFTNVWSLSCQFRAEFDREDKQAFINRYGYRKVLAVPVDGSGQAVGSKGGEAVAAFGSVM
jgi:hypothetical protein